MPFGAFFLIEKEAGGGHGLLRKLTWHNQHAHEGVYYCIGYMPKHPRRHTVTRADPNYSSSAIITNDTYCGYRATTFNPSINTLIAMPKYRSMIKHHVTRVVQGMTGYHSRDITDPQFLQEFSRVVTKHHLDRRMTHSNQPWLTAEGYRSLGRALRAMWQNMALPTFDDTNIWHPANI